MIFYWPFYKMFLVKCLKFKTPGDVLKNVFLFIFIEEHQKLHIKLFLPLTGTF